MHNGQFMGFRAFCMSIMHREFHSEALARGCQQYGIELDYRPIGQPHFGGTIERLIGTMMSMVHDLPGTTFSNPTERGSYDSDKSATLT